MIEGQIRDKLRYFIKELNELTISPLSAVEDFLEFLYKKKLVPSFDYLEILKKTEPLLAEIGKRRHFIHMVNVFLIGHLLIRKLRGVGVIRDEKFEIYWLIISLSHDIAYPIENLEKEVSKFLEKYFHSGYTHRINVTKELLFSYGNFLHYKNLMCDGYKEIFGDENQHLFDHLLVYNLTELVDHAIISAFIVMKFIEDNWNESLKKMFGNNDGSVDLEEVVKTAGSVVALHNLYNWKYCAYKSLFCSQESTRTDLRDFMLKKSINISEIFREKRCISERLKSRIKSMPPGNVDPNKPLQFLAFLLSLTDLLQEWGRDFKLGSQRKYISIKSLEVTRKELKIEIVSPYVKYIEEEDFKKGRLPHAALLYKSAEKSWCVKNGDKNSWLFNTSVADNNVFSIEDKTDINKHIKFCKKLNVKKNSEHNKIVSSQYHILNLYFSLKILNTIYKLNRYNIKVVFNSLCEEKNGKVSPLGVHFGNS